jgi:TatD DNase family protein
MIDSHCHLAGEEFCGDLGEVIARSKSAGLERALVILEAGNEKEAVQAADVERLWPETRFSVGVHPHAANAYAGHPQRSAETVRAQILRTPCARAVGEIGLDYHYDFAPRVVQQLIFRAQARLARELDLPVVVHTREADEDTLAILRQEGRGELRGVLHCFTGNADLARAGLDLGLHVSFAGIITFPNAAALREVANMVPLDRLLVETDSPFLAPVPHRGKRNEPANVAHVIHALARIHQIDPADLAGRTTANFHALFRP